MPTSTKQWNGQISNLRISDTADKELFADLSASSHRERSRRLRTLATIGLIFLNQSYRGNNLYDSIHNTGKNEPMPIEAEQETDIPVNTKRPSLSKLKDSL